MKRYFFSMLLVGGLLSIARGGEVLPPASDRFAVDTQESPDFRRHVLPLMGRLGCNGRACHGSFQGQGGFRLSLFGYDFAADHESLLAGDPARVNVKEPLASPILQKATLVEEHEGGKRFEVDSWQHRLLRRWIESGASGVTPATADFKRLEITPTQFAFRAPGETAQVRVLAHWADGSVEDVTPLCRFRSNDESIAEVDETGMVKSLTRGDTHIVAFYDNGVLPVPVLSPVSDLVGERYPKVPTPTKIDELVIQKLSQLGIVPAEVCTDTEFLRRVSLDIAGTLPTPSEIESFAADASPDKRTKKIDELLSRPSYVAWWTTRLCDYTGANAQVLNEGPFEGGRTAQQWYQWIYRRVEQNTPYNQIVAGLVLSKGRVDGQSYDDYCQQMTNYLGQPDASGFAAQETMPHYWMRRDGRKPEEMAQRFAYSFLGVRLQCAQCHKHPFDQWTKQDFDQFTSFFRRISFGIAPDGRERSKEMRTQIEAVATGGKKFDLAKETPALVAAGKAIPWPEVFVGPPGKANKPNKKNKNAKEQAPPSAGRLLSGEIVDLVKTDDPRRALIDWLRRDGEAALAKAMVNRVWSAYFNVGIIEPPDDLNLANPPSNEPLLAWLTHEFVVRGFDMKWLHREITSSRTYQLSCQSNATNRLDTRNFSHALPRRLPAEVAYNAILQATARNEDLSLLQSDPSRLAIGPPVPGTGKPKGKNKLGATYALTVFGKPTRKTNCDCERTSEPTLLQSLFLRNDQEMLSLIERSDGWLAQLSESARGQETAVKVGELDERRQAQEATAAELRTQLDSSETAGGKRAAGLRKRLAQTEREIKALTEQKTKLAAILQRAGSASPLDDDEAVRQAYLRTLSRLPEPVELARAEHYLAAANEPGTGVRDLVWALLNTKEFILNH